MPKNNDLEPVKLPMVKRFGERPTTKFVNNLDAIKVTLIDAPSIEDLRNLIPQFITATWSERPGDMTRGHNLRELDNDIKALFNGKALPTGLETIGLTFLIEGISIQEVTHILRHRMASFSAECSGDKWWTHKDALVPNSIQNSNGESTLGCENICGPDMSDFYYRYKQVVEAAKQLYCDMIDSKKISIMDARYILPRCLETFYYVRMNLGDVIRFIHQRIDKQIQPETDNVIAYFMYMELLKQFKHLVVGLVDFHAPSRYYIETARTGKATNLYQPDADSDKFEWNEEDFIYNCTRDKMNGTDEDAENHFNLVYSVLKDHAANLSAMYIEQVEIEYMGYENAECRIDKQVNGIRSCRVKETGSEDGFVTRKAVIDDDKQFDDNPEEFIEKCGYEKDGICDDSCEED